LTGATVWVSYSGFSLQVRNILAFLIAGTKAALVGLIFMHLKFERRPVIVFAVSPIVLAILFILAIAPDIGSPK
jgi:caa(3)-type oxidase subunit IV